MRAVGAEAIIDAGVTPNSIAEASRLAADEAAIDDPRPDALYRRHLTETLVRRSAPGRRGGVTGQSHGGGLSGHCSDSHPPSVNGMDHEAAVPPRMLLSDFIRHDLRLTGTHVGCEHGVCGACTILLDGRAVRPA